MRRMTLPALGAAALLLAGCPEEESPQVEEPEGVVDDVEAPEDEGVDETDAEGDDPDEPLEHDEDAHEGDDEDL